MSTLRSKTGRVLAIAVLFVFLLWFAFQVPFGHDGWRWSMPYRWEMLKTWFQGLNGRHLGNISILLMTRSLLFKVLNIGVVIFLIIIQDKNPACQYDKGAADAAPLLCPYASAPTAARRVSRSPSVSFG